jgi:hypothetical protein
LLEERGCRAVKQLNLLCSVSHVSFWKDELILDDNLFEVVFLFLNSSLLSISYLFNKLLCSLQPIGTGLDTDGIDEPGRNAAFHVSDVQAGVLAVVAIVRRLKEGQCCMP